MAKGLFATKPINTIMAEAQGEGEGGHTLKRALGPINLITLGIGAIIGAGIFVLTGTAAAQFAGPAIVISYIIAGIGCIFAGLCYAEFASMMPIAGSAYTYGYATMGELVAWIIGWALVLEYAFGAATVAVGWSGFVSNLVNFFGVTLPFNATPHLAFTVFGHPFHAQVDIFALSALILITVVLVVGVRESANFNSDSGHDQGLRGAHLHRPGRHLRLRQLAAHDDQLASRSSPRTSATSASSAGPASCAARAWSSSPTSASTPSPPPPRRPAIRRRTCPSASSDRSSSAPPSTSWWPAC